LAWFRRRRPRPAEKCALIALSAPGGGDLCTDGEDGPPGAFLASDDPLDEDGDGDDGVSEHEHPKESSGEDAMATSGPGAPRGEGLSFHFSLEGNELVGSAKIWREIWRRNPQLAMPDKKIGINQNGIF